MWTHSPAHFLWMVAKGNKGKAGKASSEGNGRNQGRKSFENESFLPLPPRPSSKTSKGKKRAPENEEDDDDDAVFDLDINSDDGDGDSNDNSDGSEEEDYSDNDDEMDDELKALVNKLPSQMKRKVLSGNTEVSDDEADEEDDRKGRNDSWGKKKAVYYTGDTADLEIGQDMADAEEEEEAAKELYKEKQSKLTDADFYDGDVVDDASEDDNNEEPTLEKILKQSKDKNSVSNKGSDGFTGRLEFVSLRKSTMQDGEVEVLSKDRSKLSNQQKRQLLESHSPELLGLAAELRERLTELRSRLNPVMDMINKTAVLPVDDDLVAYLKVKQEALLCYCLDAAFYLYLKSQGVSVKSHPVMKQLLRLRYVLEKMRTLDGKVQPQVDRLLQLARSGDMEARNQETLRPNPAALMSRQRRDDDDEDDSGDGSDQEEAEENEQQKKYVAPKISSAPYSAGETQREKSERKLAQQKRRVKSSEMMQALRDEFSAAPETADSSGGHTNASTAEITRKVAELDEERRDFEESRFVRTTVPRAEKKAAKKAAKLAGRLDNFADIGDVGELDALMKAVASSSYDRNTTTEQPEDAQVQPRSVRFEESAMKKSMSKLVKGKAEEKSNLKRKKTSSDDNEFDRLLDESGDVGNDDDEEDLLEQFAKKKKQFIAQKKAHYTPAPRYGGIEEIVEEGERRPASYEIIKNKGLTPHRAKANRNPRVKKREMFDKKVKARKGQVQDVIKGMAGSYGGESTGIKANLSRSRKIV